MDMLNKIVYTVLAIALIVFLWPLIKWIIIIVIILLGYGYFKLKEYQKKQKDIIDQYNQDVQNQQWNEEDNRAYYNNEIHNSDIIDAEYTERESRKDD